VERDSNGSGRVVLHLDHHQPVALGHCIDALAHVAALDAQRSLVHGRARARAVANCHLVTRIPPAISADEPVQTPRGIGRVHGAELVDFRPSGLAEHADGRAHPRRERRPADRHGGHHRLAAVRAAVLVPVKSFRHAKVRLAPALDPERRAALAREMASGVLAACHPLTVYVVCDDADVAQWAAAAGAEVLWRPGRGLNGAVDDGVAALAAVGIDRAVVAHSDLPLAMDLTWPARHDGVTLVPDRHDDGTNVACVPAASGFRFAYGPGSFRRHGAEARRLGLALRVVREPSLGWDVDLPADLDHPDLASTLARP
jgi:2-phospho-L-lactate guanylyltransferase